MSLNLIYKAIRFKNIKVLKRGYTSHASNNVSIEESLFLNSFIEQNSVNRFKDLKDNSSRSFRKLRETMIKTGKYKTYNSKLSIDDRITDAKSIKFENWAEFSNSECLRKFILLSSYAAAKNENIISEVYRNVVSEISLRCPNFNDEELLTLLKCLELWPDFSDKRKLNIRNLFIRIDIELEKRSTNWSKETKFVYCNLLCKLFNFYSSFVSNTLKELMSNVSNLSSTDIVQVMSLLSIYRLPKKQVSQLESRVEELFDVFEISELSIICLGFFQSEVQLNSKTLLKRLLKKLLDNLNNISDNDLGSFLKVFRYSFQSTNADIQLYEELFKNLIPIVPRVHNSVLTHISHLKATSLIYNPVLMSAIIKRFSENLETMRIKDIERIILFLTTFNYPASEPVYNLIIEELRNPRRNVEKRNFPKEYGFALRHLSLMNIYPLDLIPFIMTPKYKESAYGRNSHEMAIETFVLDQSIKIEVDDYKGPKLDSKMCEKILNAYNAEPDNAIGINMKQQIIHLLNRIYRRENAACLYRILPHFTQTDIVLCTDSNDNAISIFSELNKIKDVIKWAPDELQRKYKLLALIYATEKSVIRNTKQFTGNLRAKIRHLEKVGYIPIVISHLEWTTLFNYEQKCTYLKHKILNCKI